MRLAAAVSEYRYHCQFLAGDYAWSDIFANDKEFNATLQDTVEKVYAASHEPHQPLHSLILRLFKSP
jgi:hypothetical protein